jgi:hypothetical protein
MEVSFATGLEGLGQQLLAKQATSRAGQTLFEQYLRRKTDKQAALKAKGQMHMESESDSDEEAQQGGSEDTGDAFFEDAEKGGQDGSGAGFDDDFFNVSFSPARNCASPSRPSAYMGCCCLAG